MAARPAVASTPDSTSMRVRCEAGVAGRKTRPATNAPAAMNTLTYRHQRQAAYSVSAPPRISPAAPPLEATAP